MEWIQKNKEKLGDGNLNIAEESNFHVSVTVDPDTAIIRWQCDTRSTLQLVHGNYQVNTRTVESSLSFCYPGLEKWRRKRVVVLR